MSGPTWLNDAFAVVMAVVAVYSVGRLVASRLWARPTHADVDVAHVLMGAAMVGMLVDGLNPIPNGVWEAVFGALATWFVWRCYIFVTDHGVEGRDEDHVHHLSHWLTHLVMAGSMLYMYLAVPPPLARSGGSMVMGHVSGTTADVVGVPLLFLLVLTASAIWELDGIERFAPAPSRQAVAVAVGPVSGGAGDPAPLPSPDPGTRWLAPRFEAGCHIAMCVTMAYMLVLLL